MPTIGVQPTTYSVTTHLHGSGTGEDPHDPLHILNRIRVPYRRIRSPGSTRNSSWIAELIFLSGGERASQQDNSSDGRKDRKERSSTPFRYAMRARPVVPTASGPSQPQHHAEASEAHRLQRQRCRLGHRRRCHDVNGAVRLYCPTAQSCLSSGSRRSWLGGT